VTRRLLLGLVAVAMGWAQPMAGASASFDATSSASASVAGHTLATPALGCNPGGPLVTAVTLTWPAVSSATTPDPYATPPNSTYLADGYEVHRATGNGSFSLLASPGRTATSYVDTPGGLITTYRYKVRAKKGAWVGPFSNEATAHVTSIVLVGISTTCSA
jgi:hypothetical protein